MAAKHRRKITESLAIAKLRKECTQAVNNVAQYLVGGLEQLGHQLGQVMGAQEAMLTYLEQSDPAIADKLKAIIETKQAEAKAEAEAKAAAAKELADKKEQERAAAEVHESASVVADAQAD